MSNVRLKVYLSSYVCETLGSNLFFLRSRTGVRILYALPGILLYARVRVSLPPGAAHVCADKLHRALPRDAGFALHNCSDYQCAGTNPTPPPAAFLSSPAFLRLPHSCSLLHRCALSCSCIYVFIVVRAPDGHELHPPSPFSSCPALLQLIRVARGKITHLPSMEHNESKIQLEL